MLLSCPEGVAVCNDVSGVSILVPLFPIVMIVAVLFALQLAGFVSRNGRVGWPLALVGAAAYVYYAPTGYGSIVGALCVVIGVALACGRRQPVGASSSGGTSGPRLTGSKPKE